jgi:hypothetical protein
MNVLITRPVDWGRLWTGLLGPRGLPGLVEPTGKTVSVLTLVMQQSTVYICMYMGTLCHPANTQSR